MTPCHKKAGATRPLSSVSRSSGSSLGASAERLASTLLSGGKPTRRQPSDQDDQVSRSIPSGVWPSHVLHRREAFGGQAGATALPRKQARAGIGVVALVMAAGAHAWAFGVAVGRHVRSVAARSFGRIANWSRHLLDLHMATLATMREALAQLADCLILFIPALNMTLTLGAAQFKQRLIFRYDGAEHFNCITSADLVVVIGLRFEAQPRQSNRAGYVIHWAEVATAFADGAFAICRASQSGSDTRTAIDLLGRAQWVNSL